MRMNSLRQSHLLWSLNPPDNRGILVPRERHQGLHQQKEIPEAGFLPLRGPLRCMWPCRPQVPATQRGTTTTTHRRKKKTSGFLERPGLVASSPLPLPRQPPALTDDPCCTAGPIHAGLTARITSFDFPGLRNQACLPVAQKDCRDGHGVRDVRAVPRPDLLRDTDPRRVLCHNRRL